MEKEKKKQIAKISIFITSIFIIFISVTYAFINMTLTGTRRQVITAGNLELELLEDENNLTITNVMPMYDEVGMIQDAFTFRLVNKTAIDTNYTLKLVDITTGDKLDTSIVKYGLTKDGVSTIKLLSNLSKNELDKGVIVGNQTIEYSLRLWIDSGVEDNSVILEKSLSFRIDVEAGQEVIKQEKNWAMMQARGGTYEYLSGGIGEYVPSTKGYYAYDDYITSIVFENRIHIPDSIEEDKKWDMSAEEGTGKVMAYIEEDGTLENGNTAYKLHIQGNGGVAANEDSRDLFTEFKNLTSIEGFEYFDISLVKMFGGIIEHDGGSFESSIFGGASNLNLNLKGLDTSGITDMSYMFLSFRGQSIDLGDIDTSSVTNMSHMFSGYRGTQALDLSKLDTSSVTNMSHMFSGYRGTQALDLSKLDTSSVTNMSHMFSGYRGTQALDLSKLDTSSVTNMSNMFSSYGGTQALDLSKLNTANVEDMSFMFAFYSSNQPLNLSTLDTTNVKNMSGMFDSYSSSQVLDVSHLNTVNVEDMSNMFADYMSIQPLDLSSFDVSNVSDIRMMFFNFRGSSLDLSSFSLPLPNLEKIEGILDDVLETCVITVRDETMKAWVQTKNNNLSNIVVKSA